MAGKHNSKHPKDPRNKQTGELGACEPEYPWIGGTVDILGMENISCADPDKAEQAFHKVLYHSGASTVTENAEDPKDALTNEFRHHVRSYATGGTSGHHNGHSEQSSFNSSSSSVHPNKGTQVSGTSYVGVGGSKIEAINAGKVSDCTSGDTTCMADGDLYNEYVGNISNNTEGNKVDTICGDKCTIISKGSNDTSGTGQYLVNVQDGNMDVQLDQGKYRLKANSDILIDSTTKITLVVGSSTIVITPTDITITAANDLWLKAGNQVITSGGDSTRIQEGTLDTPTPHPKHNGIG